MSTSEAILAIRSSMHAVRQNEVLTNHMMKDPENFMKETLDSLGIPIPEGFHAHVIARGESLPDEPALANSTRNIYKLSHDGSVTHVVIRPDTSAPNAVAKSNKCNGCYFCVVIELEK